MKKRGIAAVLTADQVRARLRLRSSWIAFLPDIPTDPGEAVGR
jgi:hypothetical protein